MYCDMVKNVLIIINDSFLLLLINSNVLAVNSAQLYRGEHLKFKICKMYQLLNELGLVENDFQVYRHALILHQFIL